MGSERPLVRAPGKRGVGFEQLRGLLGRALNLGAALGYTMIALAALKRGLSKLELDRAALARDLDDAWEILAEPVQTVMRRYGIVDSYERLKDLTRGRRIDRPSLHRFIDGLELPPAARAALKELTPAGYVGLAARLAREI